MRSGGWEVVKAALSALWLVMTWSTGFVLDHPGRDKWTWLDSSPSARVGSYLDRVLKGIEDGTEAALISLNLSKAFDRVVHRFLATVSNRSSADGLAWCNTILRQWCRGTEGVRGRSRSSYPLSPLLRRLRDEGTNPALCGTPFAGPLTARVSAFATDVTVFISRRLDIKAVKKEVGEYKRIAGAKVHFDKSEGLQLGAWRGSDTLPGPFRWSDGPVRIHGVWFGPDLQLGAKLVGSTS